MSNEVKSLALHLAARQSWAIVEELLASTTAVSQSTAVLSSVNSRKQAGIAAVSRGTRQSRGILAVKRASIVF